MKIAQIAPLDHRATQRRTPDSIWPLRRADGRTWAEAKEIKK